MREPKVGDEIVVTKFDGEVIDPVIREIVEIDSEHALMLMNAPLGDGNRAIEHTDWMWNDEWRYAVRKGDRLVVTKMDGEDVAPTIVTATEDEDNHHLIHASGNLSSFLKTVNYCEEDVSGEDEWSFVEDYVAEHFTDVPEGAEIIAIESVDPINDICDSFNDVTSDDSVDYDIEDDEPFGQSYSDFNATSGGGKTLKDYTGVDITPETLGFVSNRDKTLEGITAESLAFKAVDMVEHPPHYNKYEREVIESIRGLCTPDEFRGYLKGNIIKYSARYSDKDGVRDIDKLAQYTQFLREFEVEMEGSQ